MVFKKIVLFAFAILFLSSLISAAPPFVEEGASSFSSGFFVEYTPIVTYENSKDIRINSHVFNISNGYEIDNSTTICKVSLFDSTGTHVINNVNMTFALNGNDWEYTISGTNFTKNGEYAYLVDCQDNTNNLGGFVAVKFSVTADGQLFDDARAIIQSSLFFTLIFLFIVNIFGISKLPASNTREPEGEIISVNQLKYLRAILTGIAWFMLMGIVFISSNIALSINSQIFGDLLLLVYKIMLGLTLPMLIIWFIWVFTMAFRDKKIKKLIERGIQFD